jgi:glycosyltransferase involved in cell wall biosynthesis
MSLPVISIIVPCYNQAQYLDEALNSVLNQTYENWECIIVNDGSPDNTEFVAQKWCAKDIRFKYIFQKNHFVRSCSLFHNLLVYYSKSFFLLNYICTRAF